MDMSWCLQTWQCSFGVKANVAFGIVVLVPVKMAEITTLVLE